MKLVDLISPFISIHPEATLLDAIVKMEISQNNTLLVVDKKGVFLWIIEGNTLLRVMMPKYLTKSDMHISSIISDDMLASHINSHKHTLVKDVMTDVWEYYVNKNDNIMEVVHDFLVSNLAVIPVLDRWKKPLWIIRRHAIVKIFVSKLNINELTKD